MKPTANQIALIKYFRAKLSELYDMDVSEYGDDVKLLVKTIEQELKYNKVDCEAWPADAMQDLIRTIIINR